MRVLVIKLTSMGDVIHALPALTDAQQQLSDVRFDWVVEQAFAEIPAWHDTVDSIIPVAMRRWRKQLWQSRQQICQARTRIRESNYDLIIDAQGLIKSALLSRLAHGDRHGYAAGSLREPLASRFYHHGHRVSRQLHAIERIRELFANALAYNKPDNGPDYGVTLPAADITEQEQVFSERQYLMFLHGTTWLAKQWPVENWQALARLAAQDGFTVLLPWGNAEEKKRAQQIAATCDAAQVLPALKLGQIGHLLQGASGVVAVDTGLGHLSAALGRPTVSIYGPTETRLIGTVGKNQQHLLADPTGKIEYRKHEAFDYATVPAELVWRSLEQLRSQDEKTPRS